ncbi:TylF/MycF family methyltransferase [Micromonospora sp. NPDC050417]|uniref:TylF/MycF family methyltransferase n=1 Tax=Micromonospora sp. NPDC050417 TaxID=3364280 RepID=UPI0037A32C31
MSETLSPPRHQASGLDDPRRLYCDLMKKALTRYAFGESWIAYSPRRRSLRTSLVRRGQRMLHRRGMELVVRFPFNPDERAHGRDWPPEAETMVGLRRLDNLEQCVTDVLERGVPGDLIETGVWRGGACIFMRGVLKAYGDQHRTVWVADSFRGLPKPDPKRIEDVEDALWAEPFLAVPLERVQANFRRYDLLDEQVRFLPGWFEDTLPTAPVEQVAVMRLDGDLYDSTMVALNSLYPKLSVGGYVIVDDYHAVRGCRQAVDDFRAAHGITDELRQVDWTCRYWQRTS